MIGKRYDANRYGGECHDVFASLQEVLELIRKLQGLLVYYDVLEPRAAFEKAMSAALKHCGVSEREDIRSLIDDPVQLAVFRCDVLKSMERLRVDQSSQVKASLTV